MSGSGRWLPKEWGTYKLPGLAQSNRPVIKTGPFGSSLKGEHWRETGRPVITIGSFGESGFIEDELLFVDERKAKSMIEYEVHPGDRRCLAPNPTVANVPEADMMTGPSAAMRCPLPVSEIWPLSGEEGSFSSSDQGIGRIAGEFGYHQDV